MKVVLLHDWISGYRGGERVLEAFCEMFPEAPLYTLFYEKGTTTPTIENRKITASFANKSKFVQKNYRKFLPLFPKFAESLQISEKADLVLSSSHCVIKGVKKPEGSLHISYLHSPMRYLYDQFDSYFGKGAPIYQQVGARVFRNYLTNWDIKSNQNVDHMIANSSFVQKRIEKYYQRKSEVIFPFVELKDFSQFQNINSKQLLNLNKNDYYIVVSAFAPNKRIDLAIGAIQKLNKKLIVIGSGQLEKELKQKASTNENIKFLGNTDRQTLINCLANAKAMLFPGVEDFGITPIEALAAGTPVIAFKAGGVLETLTPETALFFTEQTEDALAQAIAQFEKNEFSKQKLFLRAQDFSKEQFKKNMESFILSKMKAAQ